MKNIHVYVTPKQGVLDPQGQAIKSSLKLKGFDDIDSIRMGKFFEIRMQDPTEEKLREICDKLLANTVIEDYRFEIVDEH